MRTKFRRALERGLARLPQVDVRFGCPEGTHGDITAAVHRDPGSGLELVVGFIELFTPDDVICKVVPPGDYPRKSEGASIQLNAERCLVAEDRTVKLVHHGRVAAGGTISRARLCEVMSELCPDEMVRAGIADEDSWPITLGSTADIPALLERLFVYAYCIEQVKRFKRDQPPLSRLSVESARTAGRSRARRGSGRCASRGTAPDRQPRSAARRSRP